MKVVINVCFGGFSLSPLAIARVAELKGRPSYFFRRQPHGDTHDPSLSVTVEEAQRDRGWGISAFDIPNPYEVLPSQRHWSEMGAEERIASNRAWSEHSLDARPDDRGDADLVRAVEELGDAANGECAKLRVVEIPDGVEYEIKEYDGNEHVAETHRTWQ